MHENRRRVGASLGGDPEALALNRQVHGATVLRAGPGAAARWRVTRSGRTSRDSRVGASTADCVPVALVRQGGERPAVAVVHAGWRGLLAGVVPAAVAALGGNVAAAVGPAIGPCCFEIGAEVARPLREAFGADVVRGGRGDLRLATERALRAAGVAAVERARRLHRLRARALLLAPA